LLGLQAESYEYVPNDNWRLDRERLRDLARRCGVLVIINPHNPTGRSIPPEDLQQIADEVASHAGTLIVDEVFRIPGESASAIALGANVVVIGSLSKTHGLPGLRLGWVAASRDRIARCRTIQQYLSLSVNAVAAQLGAAVLDRHEQFSRAPLIHANREILRDWAEQQAELLTISEPQGGTTVCLTIQSSLGEMELFDRLIESGVLLVPGRRCFGVWQQDPWFRLGYGGETKMFREGLERIREVAVSRHR
jgi:aspartate/methionine/tyrosine aminotransferase